MMSTRLSLLSLVVICLCSCASREERRFSGQVQVVSGEPTILVERSGGALAALSALDGTEQWRYRPAVQPCSYLDFSAIYSLVCPVVETPGGDLLLRYDSELHVISRADGQLRWKLFVYRWAEGRLRCPVATADSGVLLLGKHGLMLHKFNKDGFREWRYQLLSLGTAVNPPVVVDESGDALLQTSSHLVSLSPSGVLNWAQVRVGTESGRQMGSLAAHGLAAGRR